MSSLPASSTLPPWSRLAAVAAAACAAFGLTTGCSETKPGTPGQDVGFSETGTLDTPGGDTAAPDAGPDTGAPEVAGDAGACGNCAAPAVCVNGTCANPADCTVGEVINCYDENNELMCQQVGDITVWAPSPCGFGDKCTVDRCANIVCEPNKWVCDQGVNGKKQCLPDGSGYTEIEPCPDEQYCSSGQCGSSCNLDPKFGAHVGCSFWTVDLPQYEGEPLGDIQSIPHYMVVSNPGELDARVTFEAPGGWTVNVVDDVVPGHSSRAFEMPPVNVLGSVIMNAGIRMDSTRPVLVHQFNPFNNANVFSNDASLLLPETELGQNYVVMTYGSGMDSPDWLPLLNFPAQNGYFTVLAVNDDTEVTVTVNGRVRQTADVPAMAIGDTHTFTLQTGEVLNIQSDIEFEFQIFPPPGFFENLANEADLTGSIIAANKPVAVFAGHEEAVIGVPYDFQNSTSGEDEGSCCAEHLEEQLLPIPMLGTDYLCAKSASRGGEPDMWRIQAVEDNVTITTDPPQDGANNVTLAKKGDFVEVYTESNFTVSGTGKLQVGQFLVSQELTEQVTGDPAFILAVPVERFRDTYNIQVPNGYARDYVTVMKPAGSTISYTAGMIPQSEFVPMDAAGTWEAATVQLTPGVYIFAGSEPFGLYAYGYDSAVSYGYPGGMDISAAE